MLEALMESNENKYFFYNNRSRDQRGHVIGKYQLFTLSSIKCCRKNYSTAGPVCDGAISITLKN